MKTPRYLFPPIGLIASCGYVQPESRFFDAHSFSGKILKSDRHYAVCRPAGYEPSGRSYPVFCLLHGAGDDPAAWILKKIRL